MPCDGNSDSAACWSFNGVEINIGMFTDQIEFDDGKIFISMEGEKCNNYGPNSYTSIRFLCDYSVFYKIDFKKVSTSLSICTLVIGILSELFRVK